MPCCLERKARARVARQELESLYATRDRLLPGHRCPIDGSGTKVVWFTDGPVTLGYLRCEQHHALPLSSR